MLDLNVLLKLLIDSDGSDLHVKVGSRPHVRVAGSLRPTDHPAPLPAEVEELGRRLIDECGQDDKKQQFEDLKQVDLALSVQGTGRFRVHVSTQRGTIVLTIRRVAPGVPRLDILSLPDAVESIASEQNGLVLVVGPAASGTSTTAAAIIDHVNTNRTVNIVTVEDPIEILHKDKSSIVAQKEIGTDARGFAECMQRIMRQDPNVLFLSDIPDHETAEAALNAAGTGILVISTMRTATSAETVTKLVEMFPPHQQEGARRQLAKVLRGIVAQQLLNRSDGEGRVPAAEILVNTPNVAKLISEGAPDFDEALSTGSYFGMQTFDQSLFRLVQDEMVTKEEALAVAVDPKNLNVEFQSAGLLDPHRPIPTSVQDDWKPEAFGSPQGY